MSPARLLDAPRNFAWAIAPRSAGTDTAAIVMIATTVSNSSSEKPALLRAPPHGAMRKPDDPHGDVVVQRQCRRQ